MRTASNYFVNFLCVLLKLNLKCWRNLGVLAAPGIPVHAFYSPVILIYTYYLVAIYDPKHNKPICCF